ncbi:MAG: tetratricopeptide repeat protein [Betaproteobacteria bacterium]
MKGSLLLELGLHAEAKAAYAQALAVRAGIAWAELGFARALKAAGQLAEAKEAAVAVLAQNPQFVAAYDLLAAVQEEQGDSTAALKTLKQSELVVPSVRRARLIGEAAYRSGDLVAAADAYSKVVAGTKNSMTKAGSDHASLAQVFVDQGEPEKAMKVLDDAKGTFESNTAFQATSGAIEAEGCVKLGDMPGAQAALTKAMALVGASDGEKATLALSKACFVTGRDSEGAAMLAKVVSADHEDTRMLVLARKVLTDTGREALVESMVDSHAHAATRIVEQAHTLARQSKFEDAITLLSESLAKTPNNTGVLLCCAQVHLLALSQKGLNLDYVNSVKGYLSALERLMPGHERLNKMQAFFRDTLGKAAKRA